MESRSSHRGVQWRTVRCIRSTLCSIVNPAPLLIPLLSQPQRVYVTSVEKGLRVGCLQYKHA